MPKSQPPDFMQNQKNKNPVISVIIPVHNDVTNIKRCIHSVLVSEYANFECIVIDDCSTDETGATVEKFPVKSLTLSENRGPAYARNKGAEIALGDIFFFIDADVVIFPDTLTKVAQAFSQNPDVDAVIGSYDDEPAVTSFISQYKNLFHHFLHQNSKSEASTFWSGCGAIRKQVFFENKGYDISYKRPAIEDIELGFRLVTNNHKIVLEKNIQVKHLKSWTFWGLIKTDIFHRAVPWTILMLRDRFFPNDLNLKITQRISVIIVYLLIILAGYFVTSSIPIFSICSFPFVVLPVLIVLINFDFYKFFYMKRGLLFTIIVLPFHLLYYFYNGIGLILGFLTYYIKVINFDQPVKKAMNNRIITAFTVQTTFNLLVLVTIFVLLFTRGITHGDAWFADASRHAMNGVYFLDLVKNMPFADLWQYTVDYYARFPALSLGYHPPFFPLVETLVFAIGGVSFTSARVAVLIFGLAGLIYWYRLIALLYEESIAFFSSLLFITTPLIIQWARLPMLELPTLSMIIFTSFAFFKYLKTEKIGYLYVFLIFLGLTVMTKQTAGFIFPVFFFCLFLEKNYQHFKRKAALIPILILVGIGLAAILMTLKLGGANLDQVFMNASGSNGNVLPRFSIHNLVFYPLKLVEIITLPVIMLSTLSLITLKDTKANYFFILWIVCGYLFMTFIGVKEIRYVYFLVPPFFVLVFRFLTKLKVRKINVGLIIAILLSSASLIKAFQLTPTYIIGFEEAAKYTAQNPKGDAILVNVYFDGNYIFNYRKHANGDNKILLRSDQLFRGDETAAQVWEMLQNLGVKYIISETTQHTVYPQLGLVRNYLEADAYKLIKKIPIESNLKKYKNESILIYELKGNSELRIKNLDFDGWRLGRRLSVPTERLLKDSNK